MCWLRRVYFSCKHEDKDVTPPRSIKRCEKAASKNFYCADYHMRRTKRGAKEDAIIRDWPCENCKTKQLRDELDKKWEEVLDFLMDLSVDEVEIELYEDERDEMFSTFDDRDWDVQHGAFIEACLETIRERYK
ncbi:hypothetical protein F5B20DRAFT_594685 [Whalleya microplaca]|nr:hypothetical protein F5B20DRAFT_594685 [Whalleya microplaca]